MNRAWLALLAGLFFSVATPLGAEVARVQGHEVRPLIPDGFCALGTGAQDAKVREAITSGYGRTMRMLEVFVECRGLESLRKGNFSISAPFGHLAVVLDNGEVIRTMRTRGEFTRGFAGGAAERHQARRVTDDWLRQTPQVNATSQEAFGFVDVDASGAYFAAGITVRSGKGAPSRTLQVAASTVIDGLPISLTINEPVTPGATVEGLLSRQKRNLAALVAANTANAR